MARRQHAPRTPLIDGSAAGAQGLLSAGSVFGLAEPGSRRRQELPRTVSSSPATAEPLHAPLSPALPSSAPGPADVPARRHRAALCPPKHGFCSFSDAALLLLSQSPSAPAPGGWVVGFLSRRGSQDMLRGVLWALPSSCSEGAGSVCSARVALPGHGCTRGHVGAGLQGGESTGAGEEQAVCV